MKTNLYTRAKLEKSEYEKQIISHLLSMKSRIEQIDALCELENVNFLHYKEHLEAISKVVLHGENADILKLNEMGFSGLELSEISQAVSSANIGQYISGLKVDQYKNDLMEMMRKGISQLFRSDFLEEIEENKAQLLADLNSISLGHRSDFISVPYYLQKLKEQMQNGVKIEGFSWGIKHLDKPTSGIIKGRLYVIGGLKKTGKTRFIINTMKNLHEQAVSSVFLSMEMGGYENVKYLVSSFTGINDINLRSKALLSEEDMKAIDNLKIDESLIAIDPGTGLTLSQVLQRIRRYSKLGYHVVFIDYLQRIMRNKGEKDTTAEHYEKCSTQIADAARQNNIAVVLLSQLNAEAEKDVPNMGNLKGSGGIGEAADSILLLDNLYRRTKRDSDRNKFDIYIEQRYGDSGKITIWSDLATCRFSDLPNNKLNPGDKTVNGKATLKKVTQKELFSNAKAS